MPATVLGQNEFDIVINDDVTIRRGVPAPFSGILVSAPRYRLYSEKSRIADDIKDKQCPVCEEQEETQFHGVSFLGGMSLGISVMAIIGALKK